MKRFLKILSANSVGIFINLLAQLFSVPLYLHNWSKELYGEWLVLTAVPGLLWSLEGGLGLLASSRMTLAAAALDWQGANEIFQTTLASQLMLSVLLFVVGVSVILSHNVATVLGFHKITNPEAADIMIFMISYMLFGMMMSVYRAAYRASEKEVRASMLINCWRASDLSIVIAVLLFHGSPVRLAECMFTGVVIWATLGFFDVRRRCSKVHFGFKAASWPRFKEMIVHGFPMLAGQLTTALYMQGFPLVVNRTLGPVSVVTLTTIRTVCRLGLLPVQTVASSTSPQLSRSYGSHDWHLFHRMLKIMAVMALWSTVCVTLGLAVLGPWLIHKWTGGKITISHLTIGLFALSVSVQGMWTCIQMTLGCCNKHHLFNYFYCLSVALSLEITLLVAGRFGFNIIPAIMLASDVLVASMGFYLCTQKLESFNPRALLCVFQVTFYREMAARILSYRRSLALART